MPATIAILHGWSDTSKSFGPLRDFLASNGFQATDILLADYISLDDDVRIKDVAMRMHAVIDEAITSGRLAPRFDLIVHSTGGLVAREWISRFYPDPTRCPVKRLLMLAPANFGSRLASTGKSMVGRLLKGWSNWFQTGTEMLLGLELASEYQWNLACRDLLDPSGSGAGPFGPELIMPFVIVGTHGYSDSLRSIVNEAGSDGTVRCAAANLNARGMTIDFTADEKNPSVSSWHVRSGDIQFPFAVLPDRDHGNIVNPTEGSGASPAISDRLGQLILEALSCTTAARYAQIVDEWHKLSEDTANLNPKDQRLGETASDDANALHQYFQIVIYVRDDQGQPVDDYFVEYYSPNHRGENESVTFHRDVLDHVHNNSLSSARRCFFVDRTDLMEKYYPLMKRPDDKVVAVSLTAANPGENVRYFDAIKVGAAGQLTVHRASDDRQELLGPQCLRRNCTHLVEIVIPRRQIPKVFRI